MWVKQLSNFVNCRRANAAMIGALTLPVLVGFAGLGVDTGLWFHQQRQAQTAADVAAYAGAIALRDGFGVSGAETTGQAEAAELGFTALNATVTVNAPPLSGTAPATRAVEVIIEHEASRLFSSIYRSDPVLMRVRAVAAFEEPTDACMLALDTSQSQAMRFWGSANVNLLACEIMSNSIASDAVTLGGSSEVEAPCVNSVGGVSVSSDLTMTDCDRPRENLSRAQDPYGDRAPPSTFEPCSSLPSGGSGSPITVDPGYDDVMRFCGGLTLNGDYHFEPGVYIVDGGTFRINGGTITGEGVTFYTTGGAEMRFNGNATIDVTAPTSGNYAGIAFWGDMTDTSAEHKFNGTAASEVTGAIYTPGSSLEFQGNFSGENGCMQLVGSTIEITGAVEIETDCTGTGIAWAGVPGRVNLVE